MAAERFFLLRGKVQHYAWGGDSYLPKLLNINNPKHQPFAEYWMGAHPSAASTLQIGNESIPLNERIAADPTAFLGTAVLKKYGELPYLFKVLDVKEMLSIQVHPSKKEAEKGFDAEEAAGIAITDQKRNYKDRNHKPEVMVALSEFWLLHGFLAEKPLLAILQNTVAFESLIPIFQQKSYKGLYQYVMELPQAEVDQLLAPLVASILAAPVPDKSSPAYWVRKLYLGHSETPVNNIDRGIFSIYFFNIVKAVPGEAVFQGAGVPHAYLEGQNVELMANSDNVLRGGLTPKHIDVPELLRHTTFEGIVPQIMKGNVLSNGELDYPCPVGDFGIRKIGLQPETSIETSSQSGEIILVLDGDIKISEAVEGAEAENDNSLHLFKGEAAYILPATKYKLYSDEGGQGYKAFVPVDD